MLAYDEGSFGNGPNASSNAASWGSQMHLAAGGPRVFPPIVTTHVVKLACELPEDQARSLSTWTCGELAKALVRDGVVATISASSVQRIMAAEKLKPWRIHHWLSTKVPRDDQFRAAVRNVCDLYMRKLGDHERVLSLDEKTSLQPRTRPQRNRGARRGNQPVLVEHEHARKGALQLFAAFDTRTGQVIGLLRRRKRQAEFIELLTAIDAQTHARITRIHVLCDNLSVHAGRLTRAWLAAHPRFQMHFTPVHCSWMNQVEQWFSILQRKRLRAPNFIDLDELEAKILAFINEWNESAHPFNWTAKSFDKVLNVVDSPWTRRRPHWTDNSR